MKLFGITAAVMIISSTMALAADSYTIDPQHAWVTFKVNHAGWSSAHGLFRTISGVISFDKADITRSSVSIEIVAASISTNFEQRDLDLQSPDFLNVAEFPQITFKSTKIEKIGEKTGKITGDLTLAGVTKPVTLNAVWNNEMALPWDDKSIKSGFSATAKFDAVADFGLKKVAEYGLGPEIDIDIDVEAFKN